MKKKVIHVTHNDSDAVGCTLVANIIPGYEVKETYFCPAGGGADEQIKSIFENETSNIDFLLLITDNSITEETAEFLLNIQNNNPDLELLLIDHHISNKLGEKYDWISVDTRNAACLNLLEYIDRVFHISETYEHYTNLYDTIISISRYDTWQWKTSPINYDEDLCQVLVNSLNLDIAVTFLTSMIVEDENSSFIRKLVSTIYTNYKSDKEKTVSKLITEPSKIKFVEKYGYKLALIILGEKFVNDLMEAVYLEHDDVDIVVGIIPSSQQLSFRTNKDNIDVSNFAKKFGGGGHKSAAGARIKDSNEFFKWLTLFYKEDNTEDRKRKTNAMFDVSTVAVTNMANTLKYINNIIPSYNDDAATVLLTDIFNLFKRVLSKNAKHNVAMHKIYDDILGEDIVCLIYWTYTVFVLKSLFFILSDRVDIKIEHFIRQKYGSIEDFVTKAMQE